jgi:hypothetical protein
MPFGVIRSRKLERSVDSRMNDLGRAELAHEEQVAALKALQKKSDERTAWALELDARLCDVEERHISLVREFDERSAWALQLCDELAEQQREFAAIKTSGIWRAARALHLTPRSRGAQVS